MSINKLYWIGVRESEISYTNNLFSGSITTYGSNENGNFAFDKTYNHRFDCNLSNDAWIDFINEKCKTIIKKDSDARFMLYYSPEYVELDNEVKKRVICNNNETIIDFLDNKITTRIWASEFINTVPFIVLSKDKIKYRELKKHFPNCSSFVFQQCESSGGSGTILINHKNAQNTINNLHSDSTYSISPYVEKSISVNTHIIIYDNEIKAFPSSIQLISNIDGHLSYVGNDFRAYNGLNETIKNKVYESSLKIGKNLKKIGYRGVCGIDYIATEDDVFFIEINPRFQASTILLNKQLSKKNEVLSIQQLQIDAFTNSKCSYELPLLKEIPSIFFYKYKNHYKDILKCFHNLSCNNDIVDCNDDDLDWNCKLDEKAYLFSIIINKNIAYVDSNNNCVIDQNVDVFDANIINFNSIEKNLINLKIMLLNQGVRLSQKAENYINAHGGLNYEEFQAIDMKIFDKYFNVPFMTRLSSLSPFEIDISYEDQLILKYFDRIISSIEVRNRDVIGDIKINEDVMVSDITYKSNDRLRIFHRYGCYFKEKNLGCKFCDVDNSKNVFTIDMIKQAIDMYIGCEDINHYLIGGGSECVDNNFEMILDIAKHLKSLNNKKISIMTTPPKDIAILHKLKANGVDEVVFNIEIFDRTVAKAIMPGKGAIPMTTYNCAFVEALQLFGKGNVRSMIIMGLENSNSFLDGIEHLCSLGVYPTISLFKPIEGTPLELNIPPSNKEILYLYEKANEICKKYNTELGPTCKYCEDNTIKICN